MFPSFFLLLSLFATVHANIALRLECNREYRIEVEILGGKGSNKLPQHTTDPNQYASCSAVRSHIESCLDKFKHDHSCPQAYYSAPTEYGCKSLNVSSFSCLVSAGTFMGTGMMQISGGLLGKFGVNKKCVSQDICKYNLTGSEHTKVFEEYPDHTCGNQVYSHEMVYFNGCYIEAYNGWISQSECPSSMTQVLIDLLGYSLVVCLCAYLLLIFTVFLYRYYKSRTKQSIFENQLDYRSINV